MVDATYWPKGVGGRWQQRHRRAAALEGAGHRRAQRSRASRG